jgi:DNA polymerase III epsilon subunit-like protein
MPKNKHYIMVLDFETDSTDPYSCNPIQLAAIVIDPVKLEIVPDSEFESSIKPENIYREEYFERHKDTLEWHGKQKEISSEQVFKALNEAPPQKVVWKTFVNYVLQYHTRHNNKNQFSAPIMAGYNIFDFDLIIMDRMCQKYGETDINGKPKMFYRRDSLDIMKIMFLWFESLSDGPESYTMDNLRKYFGLSKEASHDALKDVRDEAQILLRFLRLHRNLAQKITFRGAFNEK